MCICIIEEYNNVPKRRNVNNIQAFNHSSSILDASVLCYSWNSLKRENKKINWN